ncbi:MAG TPA: SPFH domain-containing protein [Gemmatimonadales bacterium]|jgi:regulator of protease activity HflC (stomatin/prohibitin superfamily)|nr:SPFH domain-containing protein [Gemmatimonadales bacterium]
MIREKVIRPLPGLPLILLFLVALALCGWFFLHAIQSQETLRIVAAMGCFVLLLLMPPGFLIVQPNESKVLTLFGSYYGSIKQDGFWWVNPFTQKKRLSLRTRNFETAKLKVNDANSNPIEIGAIVVWRVVDTAEAMFEVDDYENYMRVQSESAVRALASSYPYDSHSSGEAALSSHTAEVAANLMGQLQERLAKAGVEVKEARISHLAYSPEIAQAMLQRQQASAIIAARYKIVEGAVGMVENALEMLAQKNILHLDDERRAAMVSNLLVVLCGERGVQPVVNTGTLYS